MPPTSKPVKRPGPEEIVPWTPEALSAQLVDLGKFDLVVGINTRNVETTIIHVLNVVCTGLQETFPGLRPLVVVCDGSSTDGTLRMAEFYPPPAEVTKLVVQQLHGPGKGNGVRTILEIAEEVDAHACACVDGDLVSIHGSWLDNLISPILYGLADVVVPYYLRDKWDAVITNHLCYPVNAALYGSSVRQPIGGDYGLSRKFISHVLDDDAIPGDFGIDIYLTTSAIAEGFRVQETPLGIKVHASTGDYTDPNKVLSRMYLEVVGTLFELTARHEQVWRHQNIRPPVLLTENIVPYYGRLPPLTEVNETAMREIYTGGIERSGALLAHILPADQQARLAIAGERGLDAETWARVVYAFLAWHVARAETHGGRPPDEALHALGALGMGRFLRFVHETRAMSLKEASTLVKEQAQLFTNLKPSLVEHIDELRAAARRKERP